MFSRWRKRFEWSMRGAIAVAWAGTAISGIGGAFFTGRSVVAATEPTWAIVGGGVLTIVGAVLGILGIILGGLPRWPRIWRLEWLGAGLAGAGVAFYTIVPWVYVFGGQMGRLQQAGAVLAYITGFVLFRLIHCLAYDDELKTRHAAATLEGAVNGHDH